MILERCDEQGYERSSIGGLGRGAMRRATVSIGMVILFVLSSFSPLVEISKPSQSVSQATVESPNEVSFPISTAFSPSIEFWTHQETVKPMILTRDLQSLHQWQIDNDLLPEQAPGTFTPAPPSSGVVEHRQVKMPGYLVPKLAGVEGVFAVYDDSTGPEPVGALPGDPNTVKSGEIHGANDAWERGYNGSGVRVAVADSGVDFAHPDLNGTQAILDDSNSPYDGWGIMHDPISLVRWQRDGLAYPSAGNSWWVETTDTDSDLDNDSILDTEGWGISGLPISISGVYHYGRHSDSKLIDRAGGDVNIIVVDPHLSGVYDTVYIDIDRDGDFGDESPVNKGNPTYGLDTNSDGLWDQSAGLLWWISDGVNGVPYGDIYAARNGYQNRIAGAGDLILLMLNDASEAGGNHGTLCASAVAAQGVVSNGAVLGMAPGADIIAVSNLYAGGSWLDSFRFISEGYDGNATTSHDQGQIGSFSFGNSAAHDDGADHWSLYLDWLTRVHSPETTYFVAVGNGGHGYGTTASPGGAHGVISVGAFSSKGNNWGESASWSNRGPNSVSRLDPDIVAVGWSATGDKTLNEVTNANNAHTTWAGTSLATPVAAGLAAIIYEAWLNNSGAWPDSQTFRDLVMSTSDDRGYDPLVQGGGWMNASRAVAALDGDDGSLLVTPAVWMTGQNEGAHRDGNLNYILPGQNQSMQLSLVNRGSVPMDVTLMPSELVPVAGHHMVWNSTDTGNNTTWDGHQSRPDWAFPIHIAGDANLSLPPSATLVRARAVMEGEGFDGDQNLQSENRLHLRIYRWTDSDGDGNWTSDFDNDSYVDDGDWTESNELSMITEHVYESGQVEARVGNPHDWEGDGLIVALWRQFVREPNKDPLQVQFDWTAFGPANDSWISTPSNVTIAPGNTTQVNVTIDVPITARGGLKQHGVRIHATTNNTTRDWTWPVITNVGFSGPFSIVPDQIDGNVSNQTLYDETWLQGAQRWGWRAESGDWKFLTMDWPTSLSGNGSILVDVDWPDNAFTDVDVHWMSEADHPFYLDDPAAYGPRTVVMETGSVGQHQGSGKYAHYTNGGGSREIIVADDTPGTKQMLLHSAMHGVNTNDNPLNISVGYISPLDSGLSTTLSDWTQMTGTSHHRIGSTVPLDVDSINAYGFTIPQYLSSEVVYQDDPGDVTSSSYIREFTAESNQLIEVEIGCHQSGIDLDMYLYRDKNGNGILDWGNEQVGSSGNFNCDESIAYGGGQADTYWAVVHGYDLRSSNTTFWLRWSEIGGDDLVITSHTSMNSTQIVSNYSNGSSALGGLIPESVIELNLTWDRPQSAGIWGGFVDLTLTSGGLIRLPYSFTLIDPIPEVSFSLPNGTRTNESIAISMNAYDQGTGYNISGLKFDFDAQSVGSLPSTVSFETEFIDGVVRNDTLDLWQHWNSNRTYTEGDHFATTNNTLALEAESAMNTISGESPDWTFSTAETNYSGAGYMTSTADGFASGNVSSGSKLSWDVEFDVAGTYWAWIRMQRHDEFTDSIHIGVDGVAQTISQGGVGANSSGWNWVNSYSDPSMNLQVTLNVSTPGRHTVDVWVKESGVDLDRIELTTSQTWYPPNVQPENFSSPSVRWNDLTLRSAWLNWSLPSDNQWHEYSAQVLDLTNRLDQTHLSIEHDDIAPLIAINNWRMFTNQSQLNDTWIITDPEATFWLNGTQLPVDDDGRVNLSLLLQPTIWGRSAFDPTSAEHWDTSTWQWHNLNEFSFTARDPAGNWNSANATMVHDPWAPDNSGPSPQLSFNSIRVPEWGDAIVAVQSTNPYNFNVAEVSISRLFDGRNICLSIYSSTGTEMEQQCQIDNSPPWDEIPYSNSPIMEENLFLVNFTDWADDLYELRLIVTDWANNTGSQNAEILIDRTAPQISLSSPAENQILIDHHLEIDWDVSELSYQWVEVNNESVWSSGEFQNGSQELLVELARTGNHTICIYAWDYTAIEGIVDPNLSERCVDVILPEQTYWPILDAAWNDTHVNTPQVWAQISLGPDQIYQWWNDDENGSIYAIENGHVSVPIDLKIGVNNIIFHLEALEKTFVYELVVTLDQTHPDLTVNEPINGYSTYRTIANVEGNCEFGLPVIVNISGLISSGECSEDGSFEIEANLPIIEGEWEMITQQTDLAGNMFSDTRLIITDRTAPNANLIWSQTHCDRKPTAPVWGVPKLAECQVSVDLSILSDDVAVWSIIIQNGDIDVFSESGIGADFEGMQPESFTAGEGPGEWSAKVELTDAAGNRQRLQINTILDAPEATAGEQLKTPGSFENLAALGIISLILAVLQAMRSRKEGNDDTWDAPDSEEIHEADSMFSDDVVVSHEEATPSNTE